jgi:hypothetical protein
MKEGNIIMEQNVLNILGVLIGLGITAVSPFAIRVLLSIKQKVVQELGAKEEVIVADYALKIVTAIQQKYGTLANEQKFAKSVFLLEAKFGISFISESEIEVIIEDALVQLKLAQGKLISDVTPVVIAPVVPTPEVTPVVVEPVVVDPIVPEVTPVVEPIVVEPVVTPVVVEPIVTPVAPVTPEVVVTPVITPEIPVVVAPVVTPVALSDEITNAISTIVAEQIAKALVVPTIPTV